MPTISVVINTYNSAKFIRETLKSVLAQSFSDFELLIVDDGSTDNTLDIVNLFKDERIQVFSYKNGGISTSRNRGIKKASAEYISFLDHDDIWHPNKLECQLKALKESPKSGFSYSWINMIDESGELIRAVARKKKTGNIHKDLLLGNFLMTASNPLIKTSALSDIGGFDEAIYGADDWDLFLRLSKHYEAALSSHYHIQYRVVRGSGSGQIKKIEQGCLQVVEKAFDSCSSSSSNLKAPALARIYQFLCFKVLQDIPYSDSGWMALKYFRKSYRLHPPLWSKSNQAKTMLKIAFAIVTPNILARKLMMTLSSSMRKVLTNRIP